VSWQFFIDTLDFLSYNSCYNSLKEVKNMEQLLNRILEGQAKTERQLNALHAEVKDMKNDVNNMKGDISTLKIDVKEIKSTVQRIETHQEETIVGILLHVKRQGEQKDSQIKVLNQRLFDVEARTEASQ
jgi:septal ring factor EnvC (AmiA/AmiB activator)